MSLLIEGDGVPLVLLHGIGGNAESFRPQIEVFGGRYRCLAWNMPGYGGTPLVEPPDFRSLAATLRSDLSRLGIERAHFLGHSIGGMIVQELAATSPELVRSMILAATSPAFGSRDDRFRQRFLAERLAPLDAGITMHDLAAALVTTLVSTHADPDGVRRALAAMRAVPETTYRAMLECLVTFDRRESLGSHRMPALLLAGDVDRTAPAPMMERMAGRIKGARFAVVRRAGHLLHLEQPRAFNALVMAFLQEVDHTL
ncbi:MAG: alpha/beta fold hydrolase [Geminicoccaceae bacterium]|nr:alpha/beta fold hydrolase [Geminicoccaceae bacterium]